MRITLINECIKCNGFTVGYYSKTEKGYYATWKNNNSTYSNIVKSTIKEVREYIKSNFIKYM